MKTGKCLFRFVFIAVVAVTFTGCFSLLFSVSAGKTTINPDLPKEKAAVVIFNRGLYVKEYNGIDVEDAWYPKGNLRHMTVTMPAGETRLLFDMHVQFQRGNTIYSFRPKDLELKFNFEAGKEYTVGVFASKNEGNFFIPKQKIVLAIWDRIYSGADPGNREENHIIKSWELGEF